MLDENLLTAPVAGTSGFATSILRADPRDRKGRSLYEHRVTTRLYRYRFSPLIYSEHFAGLPPEVLSFIHQRLQDVLTGRDRSADFAKVSDEQRAAILEILDETSGTPSTSIAADSVRRPRRRRAQSRPASSHLSR